MDVPAEGSLLSMLAAIPDFRGRKGRRHSLAAMLAATVCGLLSGARGSTAIAQFIHNQEPSFWHALGFTKRPPKSGAFRLMLLRLPPKTLENVIRRWGDQFLAAVPGELRAVALDGKTLCGTLQPHGQSIHLLAMVDHATGGVVAQMRMPSETNEHRSAMRLLRSLVLEGRLVTGDAMFCHRNICRHITDSGGDYLLTVKDNQPELKEAIEAEFGSGRSPLHRASKTAAA